MKAVRENVQAAPGEQISARLAEGPQLHVPLHVHPEFELTWIKKGTGWRLVGDSQEQFGPGDLVLLGGNLPHLYWGSDDSEGHESCVIQFNPEFLGSDVLSQPLLSGVANLLEQARGGLSFPPDWASRFNPDLLRLLESTPATRATGLLALLTQLAEAPWRVLSRRISTLPSQHVAQEITKSCRLALKSIEGPVRLSEAAQAAKMSVPTFSRHFREITGKTFGEFVAQVRLGHACKLLAETNRSIVDVAGSSGYENLSNFNRQFRQHVGMTPRDYRSRLRSLTLAHPQK